MATNTVPETPQISEGGSRRVAFAYQPHSNTTGRALDTASSQSSAQSQKYNRYGRKASVFLIEHLSDVKDAGLGIGEKCNYWCYSKIRLLNKKWFTHCFLIIVMILYTVGGAVIFLTVEGKYLYTHTQRETRISAKLTQFLFHFY